jgi:PBP1b-binding outer membrane lipoprotein LpoB
MKWVLVLSLAAVLLMGCGITSASGVATTPEQVHAAWVDAIRNNDRTTLLNLAAEMDFKTTFVDDNVRSLQDKLRGTTYGKLQSVDVQPPVDDGATKLGISIWRFEKYPVCYGTSMAQSDGVWKVTRWGVLVEQCKGVK